MVAETSTSLFARVSFAGAECGLQSRSGLAAESFDSTSLATRFLPTTTPTTATRDDGARADARGDATNAKNQSRNNVNECKI